MWRIRYCLDRRFTDGGEVVSLTSRPPLHPERVSGTNFCYRMSKSQGHGAAGRIRYTEKKVNDFILIFTYPKIPTKELTKTTKISGWR
jgi:hypothetical protein